MHFPHWENGIFGFSPDFTLFHPFSHFFAHLHHIHPFLGGSVGRTVGMLFGYFGAPPLWDPSEGGGYEGHAHGILCDVPFNPKYAGCVYKVTVAIGSLGNIVWICLLAPGTSADVLIWDREGPKKSKGHYMDHKIGSMDGAYKGRLHVAWPFIGRKTLTERQKGYNDVHGFCRSRIEHLFARVWHWGIGRNIWRGSGTELHEYVRVLLHLQQFLIRRQVRYPPYGLWEHVPAHVWTAPTQEDNDDEDVLGDDGDVCALCCTKSDPQKTSMCDKCELQYCTDCIDTHTHTHM